MSHSVLLADPDAIVAQMSLEEKITLIGAPDWWNTAAIPRLGIPSIRMSDGRHLVSTVFPVLLTSA